jgi:hypothetical protein
MKATEPIVKSLKHKTLDYSFGPAASIEKAETM